MADEKKVVETETEKENNIENSEAEAKKEEATSRLTKDQLMETLAEDFLEYVKSNVEKCKWQSLVNIFLEYLEQADKEKKDILSVLEKKLWRKITFDDIKYFYLKTGYTLFEEATRKIFKKLKRKEVAKAILEKFLDKFEKQGLDISEVRDLLNSREIKTEEDLEKLFRAVADSIFDKIKTLPAEEKQKFLNLKVRNDEIISFLKKKWLLTDEEYKFLKGEITELSDTIKSELLNLESVLLNANVLNEVEHINDEFDKLNIQIDKIFDFWKLWQILSPYLRWKLDLRFTSEQWDRLPDNIKDELNNCRKFWPEETRKKCYEDVLFKYQSDPTIKEYIFKALEKNIFDPVLVSLVKKIVDNDFSKITTEEKEYIFDLLKHEYIDNFLNIISKFGYDKKVVKPIIDSIFDLSKDKLSLPNGKDIRLNKNISLEGNVSRLSELFDLVPVLELDLIGDEVDYFSDTFPEYFVKINDKIIPVFTKVKITTKDGSIFEWYVCETVDEDGKKNVSIFNSNCLDASWEPLKTLEENEIESIDLLEDKKLSLKSYEEIWKLLLDLTRREEISKRQENDFEEELDKIDFVDNNDDSWNVGENKSKIEKAMLMEQIQDFKKEWEKLEWDKNLEFGPGAVFTVRGDTINYSGLNWNWYHAEITQVNEEKGTFKIKLFGGILELEGAWNEYEIPMKPDILKQLRWEFNDYFYKFKKVNDLKTFVEYIKSLDITDDMKIFNRVLPVWKKLNLTGNWLVNEEWQPIRYIWRIKNTKLNPNEDIEQADSIDQFFDVFKVEFLEDGNVLLTHPYDKTFNKKVDYNTFLAIIADNDLEPWTEQEFRRTELNYTSTAKAGPNKWVVRYSLAHFVFAFKEIGNAIKNHFKEEDDFRGAEAFAALVRWFNSTSKIPVLGTVFWWINTFLGLDELWVEAQWELEARIWKRITAAKSRLERADKWGNHAKVAAKIIKNEIFSEVLAGKKLSYKKKLKAAGYLLYALEKWPSEYFRALADYAGQGLWIKALLWEWHYQKWNLINQELINQLKKDPTNEEIRNKVVFSEIFYMKDVPELTDLYSSNFGSAIEWAKINVYSISKAKEVYEWEATKGNYYVIYDGLKSYLLNDRPANFLGSLWAITERVEDYRNYVDYYKVHLMTILSGFFYNTLWTTYKEEYEKVCRSYGIPIGLFAADYYGNQKILRIMDFIVKNKWIKPDWKNQSFTEYLFWKKDPSQIDILSLSTKKSWSSVVEKMEKFWSEYGDDVVRVLDFRDISLLKSDLIEKEDADTQSAIKDYFNNKVNDNIDEPFAFKADLFKTWYSPLYREWVFNLPKIAFNKIALNIQGGDYSSDIKWIAKKMWRSISSRLDQMKEEADKKETYYFVLKKYLLWLGSMYEDKNVKLSFFAGLLTKKENLLEEFMLKLAEDKFGHYYTKELPQTFIDGINSFKYFFLSGPSPEEIYSILKDFWLSDKDLYKIVKIYWKDDGKLISILEKLNLTAKEKKELDTEVEHFKTKVEINKAEKGSSIL